MKTVEQKRLETIQSKIDKQVKILTELKSKSLTKFLSHNDIVKINNKFQARLLNYLEEEKRNVNYLQEPNKFNNIEENIRFVETFVD
jgi:hypothetical protein